MIDINFDFTLDSPGYWDGFWNRSLFGKGGSDPDYSSKILQQYHQLLWSKQLPNGENMQLVKGSGSNYLTWKDFRFGSDSIIATFRYSRYQNTLQQIENCIPDYKSFIENVIHKSYTIGGMIIFPKRKGSINQMRGCNPNIRDRWDLTLECIRRYYHEEQSPLSKVLEKDKAFFDLFRTFPNYINFFHLQDCVSADYTSVNFWIGDGNFKEPVFPQTPDEYFTWIGNALTFVEKRNQRILKIAEQIKTPGK